MDILTYILARNASKKYVDEVIKSLGKGLVYKGSVPTIDDLPSPAESNKGWLYTVSSNGHEYVSDGTNWIDLSAELSRKVGIDPQTFTAEEKLQARNNIGAASVDDLNTKQGKLTAGENITITEDNVISASGGSGEPGEYLKKAEVSSNTLTLTKKDNSTVVYTPTVPTKTSELTNDSGFITDSYHDTSKQDKLIAGNNITISDNNTISANVRTYRPLKNSWKQSSTVGGLTLEEFCTAINNDSTVSEGDAYCGPIVSNNFFNGMYFEDASDPLTSAEVSVQIMGSWGSGHVQLLTVTSSNHAPYFWQYTWVDGLADWVSWSDIRKLNSTTSSNELKYVSVNGTEYKLPVYDDTQIRDELEGKQGKLTAGTNITIDENNVISASGGTSEIDEDTFKFKQDLSTMYTIGKYNGTLAQAVTIPAEGKTFKQVWNDIFQKEENPQTVQPSVALSFNSGTYEVGSKITPSYTTALSAGSYTYGPETGVVAQSYSIKHGSEEKTTASGSFAEITVDDNTSYSIVSKITHNQGAMPVTNLGKDYPEGRIEAGTKQKTSGAIIGFRKFFYGSKTSKSETIDSAYIRALTNSTKPVGSSQTFSITVPNEALRTVIAFPSSINKSLIYVKDVNAFGTDIKSSFVKQVVQVEGANGHTAVDYDVWVFDSDAKLSANTYDVKIG